MSPKSENPHRLSPAWANHQHKDEKTGSLEGGIRDGVLIPQCIAMAPNPRAAFFQGPVNILFVYF